MTLSCVLEYIATELTHSPLANIWFDGLLQISDQLYFQTTIFPQRLRKMFVFCVNKKRYFSTQADETVRHAALHHQSRQLIILDKWHILFQCDQREDRWLRLQAVVRYARGNCNNAFGVNQCAYCSFSIIIIAFLWISTLLHLFSELIVSIDKNVRKKNEKYLRSLNAVGEEIVRRRWVRFRRVEFAFRIEAIRSCTFADDAVL